ncbi:prepilin-type N-terminal cleavage/methylation domain-containing protein [Candidatus Parcubacteria bacterium]|nr:prepilin-type N-terminal cleavage/methylation domain-containing protein [Candidatus Parcubacteria bacterium]
MYKKKLARTSLSAGFTMLELAAVLAIMTILMSVFYFNFRAYNSNSLVTNLAYEIALNIREAQTYGLDVKVIGPGLGFDTGYGVYFKASTPTSYIFFTDRNKNAQYDATPIDEQLKTVNLTIGSKIYAICVTHNNSDKCSTDQGLGSKITDMTISFLRPNPDAIVRHNRLTDVQPQKPTDKDQYSSAKIIISSADESRKKTIVVTGTGQVSIPNVQ